MPAAAKGAINEEPAFNRLENLQQLLDQDRDMLSWVMVHVLYKTN